jgi:DNA-binding transcriptional LysR family regulator
VDRLSALTVFARVAESGSFAAAGRELGVSASAAGKSVARLEARLRVRLFHRSSRELRTTAEGERLLVHVRRILAELDEAESELSTSTGEPRGVLRVSLPVAGAPFLAALADFSATFPRVDLDVELTNRNVDLVRERFDIALRSGSLTSSALTTRALGEFRMVLVASPAYLKACGTPRAVRDLLHHDQLEFRLSTSGRLLSIANLTYGRTAIVANTLDALIELARHGRGIAAVPDFMVSDDVARGALVPVLPDEVSETIPMQLVWVTRKHLPTKVRAFVDFMVKRTLLSGLPGPSRRYSRPPRRSTSGA